MKKKEGVERRRRGKMERRRKMKKGRRSEREKKGGKRKNMKEAHAHATPPTNKRNSSPFRPETPDPIHNPHTLAITSLSLSLSLLNHRFDKGEKRERKKGKKQNKTNNKKINNTLVS